MFLFSSSEEKKIREDSKNQMEICMRSFDEKSQDKYNKSMQFLSKHIQNNNQQVIEIVVDNIKATIKDDELTPARKYQAVRLLRDLMKIEIKNKNKALGKYVLKKIFKRLTILAEHKAGSNEQDRGKDIFKNVKKDQEKYSILFLNQLLLSIQEWAKTWPGVSEGLKKQFNEAYKQLLTNGVKFPKQIVRGAQPQNYRGQDGGRNSLSPYNSVPMRQSFNKNEEKSPIRGASLEQKPKKEIIKSSGKLDEKKVKAYFNDIIPSIEQFILILTEMENPDEPENLIFINDMIEQLRTVISAGDTFCTQLPPDQMEADFLGRGVISALNYSQGASKDLKKLTKNISQFDKFKAKYLKLGNQLIKGLKGIISNQKQQTSVGSQKPKPAKKVEVLKPQQPTPQIKIRQQQESSSSRKLSVPRVSAQNLYNSGSGQSNNWVIKEKSQYNSNSHHDQPEVHEKFGSFGIGGIGQKMRQQSKEKQKSSFAIKPATERKAQRQAQKQTQTKKSEEITKRTQTHKQIPSNKEFQQTQKQENEQSSKKQNTFGSFKVSSSDQNSKPQQLSDAAQLELQKTGGKKRIEQVKDLFNDSTFKQQQKVGLPRQQQNQKLEESGNFFGQFDQQKTKDVLPQSNQNDRKKKVNETANLMNHNSGNPFASNVNNPFGGESQNFSAFNQGKPQFSNDEGRSNPQNRNSTKQVKQKSGVRKDSLQDDGRPSFNDPFQNSFEFNKSNLSKTNRNSYDDKNPNFWQGEAQNRSSNLNRSKVANPFQNPQFSRKGSKSINPFEEDNKSEVSRNNKSVVSNFQFNKSFTKSEKGNPFDNPFETTSNNLSRTNEQPSNPFQTSKDQFKPPKITPKYQSVSQQASFKKLDFPENKTRNISIDNPFDAMTQNKSQINEPHPVQRMNDSLKFSIKSKQKNEGFDFDQFQNVSGAQKDSINTSSFPAMKHSSRVGSNRQVVYQRKRNSTEKPLQIQNQKSIHFSQFGDQNESVSHSNQMEKKQGSRKSVHFSDFGNFQEKPKVRNSLDGFSGFRQEKDNKKNQFDAFEVSKTSKNDFFRQTETYKKVENAQDVRSHHSGFSGFNINTDTKSEQKNNTSVDWEDFGKFQKGRESEKKSIYKGERNSFGMQNMQGKEQEFIIRQIETDRNQGQSRVQTKFIDKNDLRLNFSENTSKYHSPEFNQNYDSVTPSQQRGLGIMNSMREVHNQKRQEIGSSVKFDQFPPVEKKGYEWNPLGIRPQRQISKVAVCTDYEIDQKRKEKDNYKRIYTQQKQLLQKAKQLFNQARKVYLQKISKIDNIIKQKQSYRQILVSLKQSNENKQAEIYELNGKIQQVAALKEKILEKEKLFFEKAKTIKEEDSRNTKFRTNNNKWQIFNRNLKMMRQRESQYNSVNHSKSAYSYYRN